MPAAIFRAGMVPPSCIVCARVRIVHYHRRAGTNSTLLLRTDGILLFLVAHKDAQTPRLCFRRAYYFIILGIIYHASWVKTSLDRI